jgi:tripartite-type tricarboxylate transporter receptor subunit TctC
LTVFARILLLATLAISTLASAQTDRYPSGPVRVVVPFAAGSGSDSVARGLFARITAASGWQFVIDNKPGASGFIAAQDVKRSPPDGHTLFYTGNTTHGANSALFKSLPYDPVADFDPITRVGVFPLVLMPRPELGVRTVAELVQLAKAKPGTLTFGTGSAGPRVASEHFQAEAGISTQHVPYKSSPQVLTDLMGERLDFVFMDTVAAIPLLRGNRLKALAVTSTRRLDSLPQVPTMDELGFRGFEVMNWSGVFVARGVPAPLRDALFQRISAVVASEDWKRYVAELGGYADVLSPADTAKWVTHEIRLYNETLARAGVQPE